MRNKEVKKKTFIPLDRNSMSDMGGGDKKFKIETTRKCFFFVISKICVTFFTLRNPFETKVKLFVKV